MKGFQEGADQVFRAASEGGQTISGGLALFVIVCVIWISHRRERQKAARATRAKRKAEIEAIVKSRPEDADLFHEVLDELGSDDDKDNPSKK
ncbi:hypothetical protein [Streptomyces sp. T028]|uniref:hypothetical protein n=1 Tax=Streptomyces sp. T028 TaxID=3394379 RepID=UPI003A8C0CC5